MNTIMTTVLACTLLSVIGCTQTRMSQDQTLELTYREFDGVRIPIEWTESKPVAVQVADSIKVGDSMSEILNKCGLPYQDSGQDKHIWHYRVDNGTYLQVIGTQDVSTKVLRYSNEDIR